MWKIVIIAAVFSGLLFNVQAQSCIVCSSTQTNLNCLTPDVSEFRQTCPLTTSSSCFSRVVDGFVQRGCLSTLDNSTACDSAICNICAGDVCNDGLFPEHRLRCHQCTGPVNGTCSGKITGVATVCPLFNAEDRCYTARPEGNYERGCVSSTTLCNNSSCNICEGVGCNLEDYNSANDIYSITRTISFISLSIVVMIFNN